ncbi:TetR/AcrR family transcriptional regulator [Sphingobacterium sp. SYP-B4668]|uniref:TetR/AcrR family transcriptional regulator n=1 Tax=Sphingobacterium sp. SYP-B4668 TaxID=2996035 RepID=UPI0022DE197C|nr:TetR/AcrR family transcriptional regulator [Sphingobacterium sp. SYP-B4668]
MEREYPKRPLAQENKHFGVEQKLKDTIVQVAIRRFSHFGLYKTTMTEIAKDLQISKVNLRYYFRDKQLLIKEVLRTLENDFRQIERLIIGRTHDGVLSILFQLLEHRRHFMDSYHSIYLDMVHWQVAHEGEGSTANNLYLGNVDTFCSVIKIGIEKDELLAMEAEAMGKLILEMAEGVEMKYTLGEIISGLPDVSTSNEILEKQKCVIALMIKGMTPEAMPRSGDVGH